MRVRGFDSGIRGGGSEPTSPDRRERAGTPNNCRGQQPRTRCLVPTSSASHPAQPLGRNRGAIQSGSPPGFARGPGGTSHSGWGRRSLPVSGGGPRLFTGCARRSPDKDSEDAGSTPATSKSASACQLDGGSTVGGAPRSPMFGRVALHESAPTGSNRPRSRSSARATAAKQLHRRHETSTSCHQRSGTRDVKLSSIVGSARTSSRRRPGSTT